MKILNEVQNDALVQNEIPNTSNQILTNDLISVKLNPENGAILEIKAKDVKNGNNLIGGSSSNLSYGFLDDDKRFPALNLSPEYWKYPKDYSNEKNVSIQMSHTLFFLTQRRRDGETQRFFILLGLILEGGEFSDAL